MTQHHDAVTGIPASPVLQCLGMFSAGTETLHVANDYERRLAKGNYTASLVIGELLGKMLSSDGMVAPSLSIVSKRT